MPVHTTRTSRPLLQLLVGIRWNTSRAWSWLLLPAWQMRSTCCRATTHNRWTPTHPTASPVSLSWTLPQHTVTAAVCPPTVSSLNPETRQCYICRHRLLLSVGLVSHFHPGASYKFHLHRLHPRYMQSIYRRVTIWNYVHEHRLFSSSYGRCRTSPAQ